MDGNPQTGAHRKGLILFLPLSRRLSSSCIASFRSSYLVTDVYAEQSTVTDPVSALSTWTAGCMECGHQEDNEETIWAAHPRSDATGDAMYVSLILITCIVFSGVSCRARE